MNIRILYEDGEIIVCEKPSGLATQTKNIMQKDMVAVLSKHRVEEGEEPDIYVVHRLDQATRGIMVFAKNAKAASGLDRQLKEGFFDKRYYALVEDNGLSDEGTITDYLLHDKRQNVSRVVDAGTQGAKKASLSYKVIERNDGEALLDIRLLTGRTHQIRCQMANVGSPLCFDEKYGAKSSGGRFLLCAYMLSFKHPATGKELTYEIELNN